MEASIEATQTKLRPRELWIVAAVAFVAALVLVLLGLRQDPVGDPYSYGSIAHGLAEHGFDKVTRRAAMLYPHMLWGLYEIGLGDATMLLLHVVMHVGSCVLTFRIAERIYNTRTALIAGVGVALHPMLLRYIGELHTETLLIFLCLLTIWCAIRFDEEPSIKRGVMLGAVGMVASLAKGVMLPVVVVYAAVWFVRGLRRGGVLARQATAGVFAIGLTMIAIVAPWTYRNYVVSQGKFVLLTPGSPDAFLRGYIFTRLEFATLQKPPYTDAENESNALFKRIAEEAGTTWELDEIQDDVNNKAYAKRLIMEQPLELVRKCVMGVFTFWYEMTSLRNSLVPAVLALVGWVLAFMGFKRAREEQRRAWLIWLPIVVMNLFVACLIPLGRYSVPILPCLTMLAAFGIDTLLRRRGVRFLSEARSAA
ncbi:MAG: glycosyltransferase family 39 protein [Myxococcales bacterium]